jgi:hypothetical protein
VSTAIGTADTGRPSYHPAVMLIGKGRRLIISAFDRNSANPAVLLPIE